MVFSKLESTDWTDWEAGNSSETEMLVSTELGYVEVSMVLLMVGKGVGKETSTPCMVVEGVGMETITPCMVITGGLRVDCVRSIGVAVGPGR